MKGLKLSRKTRSLLAGFMGAVLFIGSMNLGAAAEEGNDIQQDIPDFVYASETDLGSAGGFAVFANDYSNKNHMEGTIAAKNFTLCNHAFGVTDRVYYDAVHGSYYYYFESINAGQNGQFKQFEKQDMSKGNPYPVVFPNNVEIKKDDNAQTYHIVIDDTIMASEVVNHIVEISDKIYHVRDLTDKQKIDFDKAFSSLKTYSGYMKSALTDVTEITGQNDTRAIVCQEGNNVVNVSYSDLRSYKWNVEAAERVNPDNYSLVINVTDIPEATCDLNGDGNPEFRIDGEREGGGGVFPKAEKVLFNFGDYNGQIILGGSMNAGVILAPDAYVEVKATHNGNVISNKVVNDGCEIHQCGFDQKKAIGEEPTPSVVPSVSSSVVPSVSPSVVPSVSPSVVPSVSPSVVPSVSPSVIPSVSPSVVPSVSPSVVPSESPSVIPSVSPSVVPSVSPSVVPSVSPSVVPSVSPSVVPSVSPSVVPSVSPSVVPSVSPSVVPSVSPSVVPSVSPSVVPSVSPSVVPSVSPSVVPSVSPSAVPSVTPSVVPSVSPSVIPSVSPSVVPSESPSVIPSVSPSVSPSVAPSQSAEPTITTPTETPAPTTTNTTQEPGTTVSDPNASQVPTTVSGPNASPSTDPTESPSVSANASVPPTADPTQSASPAQSASASPATNNNNSSNQGTSRATVTDPTTNTTTVVPVSYTYERSSENSKEVTITITSIPDEYVPTSNTITVNIDEPTTIPGTPVIITIEEEDVPLAGAPKTGENNIPFMIFGSAFTMVIVAGITYFFSKKSEEA